MYRAVAPLRLMMSLGQKLRDESEQGQAVRVDVCQVCLGVKLMDSTDDRVVNDCPISDCTS